MQHGKAAKYEDAGKETDRVNPYSLHRGVAAGLCLPFKLAGERVGVIQLADNQPRTFSQDQIDIYCLHANQAARPTTVPGM